MGGQQDKFAVAPDSTAVLSDHTPIFGCFEEGANGLSVEEACAHRDRIASYFVRRVVPNGASIFSHKVGLRDLVIVEKGGLRMVSYKAGSANGRDSAKNRTVIKVVGENEMLGLVELVQNVEQEADEATGRMPTDVLAQGKTYLLVLSQDKYIKEMMAKRDSDVACGLFCDNLLNLTKDKVLAWLNKGSVEIAVDEDENVVLDKKGSYFGELALIREEPRAAAVKARGATILARISGANFKKLCLGSPSVAAEFEIKALGTKASVGAMLVHPRTAPLLKASLDKELATENYECWDAIEAFRFAAETAADDKLAEQALAIYKKWIDTTTDDQVNLSGKVTRALKTYFDGAKLCRIQPLVKSKSIRLTFGRIDFSRRALEAKPKSSRRNCRTRSPLTGRRSPYSTARRSALSNNLKGNLQRFCVTAEYKAFLGELNVYKKGRKATRHGPPGTGGSVNDPDCSNFIFLTNIRIRGQSWGIAQFPMLSRFFGGAREADQQQYIRMLASGIKSVTAGTYNITVKAFAVEKAISGIGMTEVMISTLFTGAPRFSRRRSSSATFVLSSTSLELALDIRRG
ncbi:hypothetical protein AURANDRAFT_68271 [Aureococcus anophagefferens]|uniref:Cyclic nucleotide-binding domain-containing protein n=1 Tax=Aureococcus anophagefferens TaxID=44056 RepID=F0YP26_AURAN|nr:hypothetical protein AURANDRAFT_68271 [Aureococcus anophagefferens]EGB03131.1 hypothetical protein AURANDRAFT_68271 [Aureococcus anophagefferens]|eukprot:XP_009042166.1 hypothetical protein AURANDRAFT_68271 [Aureococcus anophagefferens]